MKLKIGRGESFIGILDKVNFKTIGLRKSDDKWGVTVTYEKNSRSYYLRLVIDDVDSWPKHEALTHLKNIINDLCWRKKLYPNVY